MREVTVELKQLRLHGMAGAWVDQAVDILRAFGGVCTSDAAMLRLVALAMDALRGRLRGAHDIEYLWDEMPGWIVRGRLAEP